MGEINVVQRMVDVNALLGGEGNGGVIDPRVGYVRDSFIGMAMVLDLMAATGETLSSLVAGLPRFAMVKEQYPLAAGAAASPGSLGSPAAISALWDRIADAWPDAAPIDATDFASTGKTAGCMSGPAIPSPSFA